MVAISIQFIYSAISSLPAYLLDTLPSAWYTEFEFNKISFRIYFLSLKCKNKTRAPNKLHFWARLFKTNKVVSNVSLKFQMLISEMCQYFLLKKCVKLLQCKSFSHFFNKNISVFSNKLVKHLTS